MPVRGVVRPSCYRDSVALMRIAQAVRAQPGVREAAALMGTPANHALLAAAGLAAADATVAGPGDLVVAVDADSDRQADEALGLADRLLAESPRPSGLPRRRRPRTLETALRLAPDTNLVTISVPGPHAAREARRALARGRHVFLFSDHVTLADEVRLKTLAARRGLLCMGPDCGTAYVDGIGLGFANVVPRGRIGIVAASGTGLQAVAAHVTALGEGISQGIGVGGRDLTAEVGGRMTLTALRALDRDPSTAAIVLVSKPPAPAVVSAIETALTEVETPTVVCCLGAVPRDGPGRWVETLEDAAHTAVAIVQGRAFVPRAFGVPADVRAGLARLDDGGLRRGPALLGLYSGGTLAAEARLILGPLLGPVVSNLDPSCAGLTSPHRILDLGADEFTVGRPHPMLDPDARAAQIRAAGAASNVGVLLLDLVLGRAAHPDPALPLAGAIRDARARAAADGRGLAVVVSVVGTSGDPQGLSAQLATLEAARTLVLPSNAQAARAAALLVHPALSARFPELDGA